MTSTAFGATKTATVNGTTLAYREHGEGEPVIFVHGGLSDLRTCDQQLPSVGIAYRAITYSRRHARPNDDIDPETAESMISQRFFEQSTPRRPTSLAIHTEEASAY